MLEIDVGLGRLAVNADSDMRIALVFFVEAIFLYRLVERGEELLLQVGQPDAVLRTLRTGHAGRDVGEIQLKVRAVDNAIVLGRNAKKLLRLEVGLERFQLRLGAARGPQVINRLRVDREITHGRAILGRHVRDRGAIRQRERSRAGSVKFDELADDLLLAKHFGDMKREIRGRHAFAQRTRHVDADDFGGVRK